ncbi:MAG: cysteine desulfurase [Candidatus Promineofilum sp.]|nr:cysteine desulfurase [Promineifilum sp.]
MPDREPIYLDYNATTPVDPRVLAAMLPYFSEVYGNPANGLHRQGRLAARAVDEARERVADLIGAQANEIVFTAGATESNTLAIEGLTRRADSRSHTGPRRRIVTTAVEHKAVLEPCRRLGREGWDVVVLPVDHDGVVDVAAAAEAIDDNTLLVSVQAANNEVGTIQPVAAIAALAHAHGALIHCDAAQAVGKVVVDVAALDVDLLSASAHKLYGPKGIGLLYVRGGPRRLPLQPVSLGGGQEAGLRAGTSNVPGIVGFGKACSLAKEMLQEEGTRQAALRNQLEEMLIEGVPGLVINGRAAARLPNTSSLTFPSADADALLLNLPNLMLATGSACTTGAVEPSHVLQAMGVSREAAYGTVRVSMGRNTQPDDVVIAIALMQEAWLAVREGGDAV